MASDKNKRSWAVFHTAYQMMQDFGLNRSYFITVTLKGYHRSSYINEKLSPFLDFLHPVFPMILAVHGQKEASAHVHILAVASLEFLDKFGTDKAEMNSAVSALLRKAKAKFKFGRCFDVKPVTEG